MTVRRPGTGPTGPTVTLLVMTMSDWIPRPYRIKVDSDYTDGPKQGDIVYRWTAPTYGVVGAREVAVTFQPDEAPFFSVDREDLEGARFVQFILAYELGALIGIEWVPYD